MSLFDKLFGTKASAARTLATQLQTGQAVTSASNYASYAREGYQKNVVAFRCIQMIAGACAGIELEVYQKRVGGSDVELESHPLITLLDQPNPMQSRSSFIEYLIAYYLLSGNTYVEAVRPTPSSAPFELWPIRPDQMKITAGKSGYPANYFMESGGAVKVWPVDPIKLSSDILHVKSFHPSNYWYGMSPLEAALLSLDQSNAASKWNLSLLQNSATPSGVLQVESTAGNPRGSLTNEQYERLRSEFYQSHAGARNAGKPLLLEGGVSWSQISLSPKDMDFLNAKSVTSQDVALVFGVPSELLGLGQKTFNNYKEARLSFYEETILPLMDNMTESLTRWLAPAFGDSLKIEYDKDDIEALTYKRESKFSMVKDATYLTQNEKREAVGYDSVEGWDVFLIGNQLLSNPSDMGGDLTPPPSPSAPDPEDDVPPPAKSQPIEDGVGYKSFNLLNRNEKVKSWKRQNKKRDELAAPFERDLKNDLDELAYKLTKSTEGIIDPRLIEFALMKALGENMGEIKKTISRHVKYALKEFGFQVFDEAKSIGFSIETKANRKFDQFVQGYIDRRTATAITEIEGATKKKVHAVVKRLVDAAIVEGESGLDLSAKIGDEFSSLSAGRARLIARTEVTMASTNGQLEAVKSLQVPGMVKEWVSANDDRVRDGGDDGADANHADMDGVTVSLDEKFNVPPDADMECPGDPSGGASQVCNCRCALVYKVKD